ncbi:hypothetical protein [Ralstonia sp. UBA689]|uniref:hypothetical protein n=1 Tax=Ralstonia sp. UBA689 TaxID=1947373 RepID=UPI0025D416F5|nr:hypothetical protein [Ralstonia sp. UBA689]
MPIASYPSPPPRTNYELGALAAREFLLDKQLTLARYRLFRPSELREVLENDVGEQCKEYRAGFLDAIGAYICLTLEGSQPDPANWNPLTVMRARRL